jgi:hypothetical protein
VLLTLTLETEAFEQPDLFLLHLDLALARGFRRPEQALALGEQVGAGPHAVHAACGYGNKFPVAICESLPSLIRRWPV